MEKRIVIKVGTSVLTANGSSLNRKILSGIVKHIAELLSKKWQVVLVSSGAVGAGKEQANFSHIKKKIIRRQMYAAIGQARLMHEYDVLFKKRGLSVGQALLTRDDFCNRERYTNALQTLQSLLAEGITPVVNENDVISIQELSFGDNDLLAAITAIALQASHLLFMTNREGVMNDDPSKSGAQRIPFVALSDHLKTNISSSVSEHGIGGMQSKINAARLAAGVGINVSIASGLEPKNISRIIEGEDIGTRFELRKKELTEKDRWMVCARNANAGLIIDSGAAKALGSRKSLLYVGLKKVNGTFKQGEIIQVNDDRGKLIAFGAVNFDSETLREKLNSQSTSKDLKEIIHANHMQLL